MLTVRPILRTDTGTAVAAEKGNFRVRDFGGVYAFPVHNRQLLELGVRAHSLAREKSRILAVLSVGTRQRKRCAAEALRAAYRPGQKN